MPGRSSMQRSQQHGKTWLSSLAARQHHRRSRWSMAFHHTGKTRHRLLLHQKKYPQTVTIPTAQFRVLKVKMLLALSEMKLADSISLPCVQETWNNIPTPSAIFLDTNFPPPVLEWIIHRCASDGTALHLDPVSTVKALKNPPIPSRGAYHSPQPLRAGIHKRQTTT